MRAGFPRFCRTTGAFGRTRRVGDYRPHFDVRPATGNRWRRRHRHGCRRNAWLIDSGPCGNRNRRRGSHDRRTRYRCCGSRLLIGAIHGPIRVEPRVVPLHAFAALLQSACIVAAWFIAATLRLAAWRVRRRVRRDWLARRRTRFGLRDDGRSSNIATTAHDRRFTFASIATHVGSRLYARSRFDARCRLTPSRIATRHIATVRDVVLPDMWRVGDCVTRRVGTVRVW